MRYTFKAQLAKGEEQEAVLDKFFRSRGFKIAMAEMPDQRRGIDRWFECSHHAGTLAIEYKADFKAQHTGNVYLETVSVGKYVNNEYVVSKRGWLWTTHADYLMYLLAGLDRVLLFVPGDLRDFVVERGHLYRTVQVKNRGYQGRGLLVPIADIEKIAKRDWEL